MFQVGILRNAELSPLVYPGWEFRVYVAPDIPERLIAQLRDVGACVITRHSDHVADGLFWRFEGVGEPGVDALCARDADSRLTVREKEAVDVWLESGAPLHIMRDHPAQNSPIMAGMCGFRGGCLHRWNSLLALAYAEYSPVFGMSADQVWLAQQIYPLLGRKALINSECVRFRGENIHPFPSECTSGDFVGRIFDEYNQPGPVLRRNGLEIKEYPLDKNGCLRRVIRNIRFDVRRLARQALRH